ncbi:HAD-IA family hydrolase [Streptomyces dubilierae]|uniref:HAD-IA family hydrolase n=1 Tax=Streptomyces dubilierae TaxID=3075533 RepID=A0ABU2P985_9ACTN|nr:HAD-IA family hydrolase [Streptomyces sp. DSM 41921]MDT0387345.1 HAD-IA family hydrolase [Streptomyces sp. DSM 41921]
MTTTRDDHRAPVRAPEDDASATTVWFDFGGVLTPTMDELYARYAEETGISPERLRRAVADVGADLGMHPLAPLELGRISEAEWGARVRAALRARHPDLDLGAARLERFGEQWLGGRTGNPVMAAVVRAVRAAGHPVGLLTNNVPEWEGHWRRITAPAGRFDAVVDSCRVGVRKPDPAVFRIAAAASPTARHVLVDDLAENCAAAAAAGWRTVRFRDDAQASRELSALLGIPLPGPGTLPAPGPVTSGRAARTP